MLPQILYSLSKIKETAERLSTLAKTYDINILVAVKSLPHKDTLHTLESYFQGHDISNSQEFDLTSGKGFYSVTNCPLSDLTFLDVLSQDQFLISCSSLHYIHEIQKMNKPFVIRLRSSDLIVDQKVKKSRFGLTIGQLLKLNEEVLKSPHFKGFHFHHAGEDNTLQTYKSGISAIKKTLVKIGINEHLSINLGGGLSNLTFGGMRSLFEFSRKELPGHKIYIEPGRYLTENVGQCFTEVIDISEDGDSLIVNLNISRECHLKWSYIRGIQIIKNSESAQKYYSKRICLYGNTCFENDLIGSWDYEQFQEISVGDKIVLANISGYSMAWNNSFNGIPPITISFN